METLASLQSAKSRIATRRQFRSKFILRVRECDSVDFTSRLIAARRHLGMRRSRSNQSYVRARRGPTSTSDLIGADSSQLDCSRRRSTCFGIFLIALFICAVCLRFLSLRKGAVDAGIELGITPHEFRSGHGKGLRPPPAATLAVRRDKKDNNNFDERKKAAGDESIQSEKDHGLDEGKTSLSPHDGKRQSDQSHGLDEKKATLLPQDTNDPSNKGHELEERKVSLAPLDYGINGKPGPDGMRKSKAHPAFLTRCHACPHHKFLFVTVRGNAEKQIVENLKIVMCANDGLQPIPNCGNHLIEVDCSAFRENDDTSWFMFSFSRNPWDRAISSWSLGSEIALGKHGIPPARRPELMKRREENCPFSLWVNWEAGRVRDVDSCAFSKPDLQSNALFTNKQEPALNFIGRLEYYDRDMETILMRIDPSGDMAKHHRTHANSIHLHQPWHPKDFKIFYRQDPSLWDRVAQSHARDISLLGYVDSLD